MAKKRISRQKKFLVTRFSAPAKYIGVGVLALIVTLVLGTTVGPWRNVLGAKDLRALFVTAPPPPPLPSPANPSKEYIYAGGRLVATEEPAALAAPASLVANTLSHLQPSQIQISWDATTGADHYEVERTTHVATPYTPIALNVNGTTFTDNSVSSVTAYLYRVRAVGAGGGASPYSNIDVATAISFTDDTLDANLTTIKLNHFTELREAVNAVRATTSVGKFNQWEVWYRSVTEIKASHILGLRSKLDLALSTLNLPACSYTSIDVGLPIQKVHIEQLRKCVK